VKSSAVHSLSLVRLPLRAFCQKVLMTLIRFTCLKVGRPYRNHITQSMKPLTFCFILLLGFVYLFNPSSSLAAYAYTLCNGSIAQCNEENEQLESEISRRFLAQKSISYGALNKDRPACNSGAPGQSYSNSGDCLPPPANPPDRGCPKYYRCRSGS
jgi:hypothetical protein